jgi:hypothetical protein
VPRLLCSALWPRRKYHLFLDFDVGDLRRPDLQAWIEDGKVRMRLDPGTYTLATLSEAHTKCETCHSDGKIVVAIADN